MVYPKQKNLKLYSTPITLQQSFPWIEFKFMKVKSKLTPSINNINHQKNFGLRLKCRGVHGRVWVGSGLDST